MFQSIISTENTENKTTESKPKTKPLRSPKVGSANSHTAYVRHPTQAVRQPAQKVTPDQNRKPILLSDLLPPNIAAAQTRPKKTHERQVNEQRIKCPKKYSDFNAMSSNLPAKITLNELKLCSDILTLGYYCAASDGSISSQEDDYLKSWSWCVIEKTSDSDSHLFHKALGDIQSQAMMNGKKNLGVISELANRIRQTGERKLVQCAGYLCSEIIECNDRLEPGEYSTLSVALKYLGIHNIKAKKIAEILLFNDNEISKLKNELSIDEYSTTGERELIISREWSKLNGRINVVTKPSLREEMKHRMLLIQKIRDLYREIEAN